MDNKKVNFAPFEVKPRFYNIELGDVKIGDIVRLKSSFVNMTATTNLLKSTSLYYNTYVECGWFNFSGDYCEAPFHIDTLIKVDSINDTNG